MNRANIQQLGRIMGLLDPREREGWVMFQCPFAPWEHAGGTDRNPSFGISIHDKGMSRYHCFSCGKMGLLLKLTNVLGHLYRSEGQPIDYKKARAFMAENESWSLDPFEDEEDGDLTTQAPTITEHILKRFDSPKKEILADLGLTPATAKKYEIRHDWNEDRLVWPVRDQEKRLVGLRGRIVGDPRGALRYKTYNELSPSGREPKAFGVWYLEQFRPKKGKAIVVVEGERDALTLLQTKLVSTVWSSMGASVTKRQVASLAEVGAPVILFMDDDEGGEKATAKIVEGLRGYVPLFRVSKFQGCNDPAELVKAKKIQKALQSIVKV